MSFHHSNVIPSFQCHSIFCECHSIIPMSFHHSNVIPSFKCHSVILMSLLHSYFILSLYHHPDVIPVSFDVHFNVLWPCSRHSVVILLSLTHSSNSNIIQSFLAHSATISYHSDAIPVSFGVIQITFLIPFHRHLIIPDSFQTFQYHSIIPISFWHFILILISFQ